MSEEKSLENNPMCSFDTYGVNLSHAYSQVQSVTEGWNTLTRSTTLNG